MPYRLVHNFIRKNGVILRTFVFFDAHHRMKIIRRNRWNVVICCAFTRLGAILFDFAVCGYV